jgi:hypothetical protein
MLVDQRRLTQCFGQHELVAWAKRDGNWIFMYVIDRVLGRGETVCEYGVRNEGRSI